MHLSFGSFFAADTFRDRATMARFPEGELIDKEESLRTGRRRGPQPGQCGHGAAGGGRCVLRGRAHRPPGPPFPNAPVNIRLADAHLAAILARAAPGLAVAEPAVSAQVGGPTTGLSRITREAFVASDRPAPSRPGRGTRKTRRPAVSPRRRHRCRVVVGVIGPPPGLPAPLLHREAWVDLAAALAATHVTVVPTMLGRILDVLTERDQRTT